MEKFKEVCGQIKSLINLNYCLIFNKCFYCHASKGKRFIFCSLGCAVKTVKG